MTEEWTEEWTWASEDRIKEAAEELKALIRVQYPDAKFRLAESPYDRDTWTLWTYVDIEDPYDVYDLTRDREVDMLSEEHIPLHVRATRRHEAVSAPRDERATKVG